MIRRALGQSLPTLENLEKIAHALNVTVQSLFDNDYYADINTLKNKLYKKIDNLSEQNTRFLYIVASQLD